MSSILFVKYLLDVLHNLHSGILDINSHFNILCEAKASPVLYRSFSTLQLFPPAVK